MSYVIFRLDDVQDYWLTPPQTAIIDRFSCHSSGLPSISIGIIGGSFGQDVEHVRSVQKSSAVMGERMEIVCHSCTHTDFSLMSFEEQLREMEGFKDIVGPLFPEKSVETFIPPFNRFNEYTMSAMNAAGYKILSARRDNSIARPVPSGFLSMPASVSTSYDGNTSIMLPPDLIFKSIQQVIEESVDSFCVVMMHPQEFSKNLTSEINKRSFDILGNLIDRCIESDYEFVTFSQLRKRLLKA